jgi:hypothetical protein
MENQAAVDARSRFLKMLKPKRGMIDCEMVVSILTRRKQTHTGLADIVENLAELEELRNSG